MIGQSSSTATTRAKPVYQHLLLPGRRYRLLAAIDNDDNAATVVRTTAALAERGADPIVVKAMPLMAPVAGGTAADATILFVESALADEVFQKEERVIGDIVRSAIGSDPGWPIKVIVGEPAAAIVHEASENAVELLVLGINPHSRFSQALGENTTTRVISNASMPIFGVRPNAAPTPRVAMVATDFGDASWEAARLAANLVEPGGTVVVGHVTLSSPVVDESDEGQALIQQLGIEGAFERLATEIQADKSIQVKLVTRDGDAGTELLTMAELIKPDVIAAARQRHGLVTRLLLGSVSRKLVREGEWSMLITPPPRIE